MLSASRYRFPRRGQHQRFQGNPRLHVLAKISTRVDERLQKAGDVCPGVRFCVLSQFGAEVEVGDTLAGARLRQQHITPPGCPLVQLTKSRVTVSLERARELLSDV